MKYIKEAVEIFFKKENFIYFLKIYSLAFVMGLISFVYSYIMTSRGYTSGQWFLFIPTIVLFPIGLWSQASGYEAVKRVVSRGVFEFKDTYRTSWKYLWKFFLVSMSLGLIIVGGFILLIIPAIIFGVWFAFSLWGVVDKGYKVGQSLRESKALVKGKFWKVLGKLAIFVLFAIAGQLVFSFVPYAGPVAVTIFGGLFLLPYFLLYRELGSEGSI